jgi:hypothetical protein
VGPYTNLIWLIGFAALALFLFRRLLRKKDKPPPRDDAAKTRRDE